MTCMFDQFEQPSIKSHNNNLSTSDMSTLGYINMTVDPEPPIFSKSKRDFTPVDRITHAAVANNQFVLILANNTLIRMDIQTRQQEELSLNKHSTVLQPTNLFLDPSGNHALIALSSKNPSETPEAVYLSRKSNRFKTTQKFRGHEFTQVGWGINNVSESSTGPVLMGTSKGLIFETEIAGDGDKYFTSLEQYWRQVFDIGKGTSTPITGLAYYRLHEQTASTHAIFASTPQKLYFFVGRTDGEERHLLQQVFQRYLNVPEHETYFSAPTSSVNGTSRLCFFSENLVTPDALAWAVDSCIFHCPLVFGTTVDPTVDQLSSRMQALHYPMDETNTKSHCPIAMQLLQFHVLLAHSDSIKAVSLLYGEVCYEDNYNEAFGRLVALLRDQSTGDVWSVSETALFRLRVHREERDVWWIFAEQKKFDLAKKYAAGNPVHMNQVLIKEADTLFESGDYEASAQRYAETRSGFEEIALKFLQIEQQDSLKIFLRRKLDTLRPQDKTQITMIVVWLVELYLSRLESKRLRDETHTVAYMELQKEFEIFLALEEVSQCIRKNRGTVYELMSSHGDQANLIKLTIINKDFERLIRQHIYKHCYHDALEVLKSQNNYELYYQFAPILMQEIPKLTVRALMEQGRKLVAVRLLPALVTCTEARHVIDYLEYCVEKLKNVELAVHNFLISLYAKSEPQKLVVYFTAQGRDCTMVNYDVHFALRICQEHDLTDACVHLSAILGLWESAVELAIGAGNVELAMDLADQPPEYDTELRKKLWLKIAKYVVEDRNDIKQAMEFLKKCELLRIEDILPFFPDFVTIDHFKEAICNSLYEYNVQIQTLKEEMEDATKSAEMVRGEIQTFRNRYTFVGCSERCGICNHTLMTKPFYLFPCQHKFHKDCLTAELLPLLGPARRNKLADLERQLRLLSSQTNAETASTGSGLSTRDVVKAEIDDIVAAECFFCGENMIQNIDKPFIEDHDYDRITKEWE